MATTTNARHRADTASPITTVSKALGASAIGPGALVVAVSSGLVLSGSPAANADAGARESQTAVEATAQIQEAPAILASPAARISFERPKVSSKAAPAPKPSATLAGPRAAAASLPPAPTLTPAARTPVQAAARAGERTAPASQATVPGRSSTAHLAPSEGIGAAIIAAAYAQLGVQQDCTMLVTHSLAAAGINFHGWPKDYLTLGRTVSAAEARPGDLVYYPDGGMGEAHIAVYAGNGQAIHGGWNGATTVLFSVNVGTGHTFIHVGK
ncbi:NlpC/P60 family protein [Arthrobacter bambusae]|uniref:Cell wall-associated NlpC family hydrolase n=1 Tax=Arthrobacter bambusae TaxID=1338426 RepID=A0AAW8DIL3_9MICC|nr:NlpC/P60 family protein [Arthrobacter bambusae]MDP9904668.1 cell wall-associated NlpC family hydrolase [Arthrobacter bambusae]MDQ0129484.1 cell wall-associated NlpC family hydrolase [Arthrobacter bambusae]MDQ0180903.1 cell wall-associated NlpC family hydrolase [Arthrobacter bambusae]